jgi:hypothetical protein
VVVAVFLFGMRHATMMHQESTAGRGESRG